MVARPGGGAVTVGRAARGTVVSEQLIPAAAQVTLGAALGFCVGYLLKKVGVRRPEQLERQWRGLHGVLFANVAALAGAVPGLVLGG